MSYDFWKCTLRGMVIADLVLLIGIGVFLYFNGAQPAGEGLVWLQFRLLSVIMVIMIVGTGYVHTLYKVAWNRSRLQNLDRVHPMGNGRRRFRG